MIELLFLICNNISIYRVYVVMLGRDQLMYDKIEWAYSSCENKISQRKVQNNMSEKWKQ